MASELITSRALAAALQEEGLLPPRCNLVEVLIAPTGVPTIRYTVYVAREDLSKLARALERAAKPEEPNDA